TGLDFLSMFDKRESSLPRNFTLHLQGDELLVMTIDSGIDRRTVMREVYRALAPHDLIFASPDAIRNYFDQGFDVPAADRALSLVKFPTGKLEQVAIYGNLDKIDQRKQLGSDLPKDIAGPYRFYFAAITTPAGRIRPAIIQFSTNGLRFVV